MNNPNAELIRLLREAAADGAMDHVPYLLKLCGMAADALERKPSLIFAEDTPELRAAAAEWSKPGDAMVMGETLGGIEWRDGGGGGGATPRGGGVTEIEYIEAGASSVPGSGGKGTKP